MTASPVNPSDLLVVRGEYGKLPTLPATPGFEGVGVVDRSGGGMIALLRGLKPGKRVAVICAGGGAWAEYVVVPAHRSFPCRTTFPTIRRRGSSSTPPAPSP